MQTLNMCRIINSVRVWYIVLPATTYCLQFLLFANHLRHCEFVFASNDSLALALSVFPSCSPSDIVIGSRERKKTEVKQIKGTRAYYNVSCVLGFVGRHA